MEEEKIPTEEQTVTSTQTTSQNDTPMEEETNPFKEYADTSKSRLKDVPNIMPKTEELGSNVNKAIKGVDTKRYKPYSIIDVMGDKGYDWKDKTNLVADAIGTSLGQALGGEVSPSKLAQMNQNEYNAWQERENEKNARAVENNIQNIELGNATDVGKEVGMNQAEVDTYINDYMSKANLEEKKQLVEKMVNDSEFFDRLGWDDKLGLMAYQGMLNGNNDIMGLLVGTYGPEVLTKIDSWLNGGTIGGLLGNKVEPFDLDIGNGYIPYKVTEKKAKEIIENWTINGVFGGRTLNDLSSEELKGLQNQIYLQSQKDPDNAELLRDLTGELNKKAEKKANEEAYNESQGQKQQDATKQLQENVNGNWEELYNYKFIKNGKLKDGVPQISDMKRVFNNLVNGNVSYMYAKDGHTKSQTTSFLDYGTVTGADGFDKLNISDNELLEYEITNYLKGMESKDRDNMLSYLKTTFGLTAQDSPNSYKAVLLLNAIEDYFNRTETKKGWFR